MSQNLSAPIDVVHLFPVLDGMLIELLKTLRAPDWQTQTIASRWTVRDVASHLLDGNIRLLSMLRDGYFGERYDGTTHADLVDFLNRLNADWVQAMQRVSPQMLIQLHELTGKSYCTYLDSLNPLDKSDIPVDWAGETESLNWMAIAREYSEKWLRQQQIRDALGMSGLMTPAFFTPFIHIFMLALPHTYRDIYAPDGSIVQIDVTTEIGGSWFLVRDNGAWHLTAEESGAPAATVSLDPDTAWKLFSRSVRPERVIERIRMTGDEDLAIPALGMVAVMA